MPSGSTYRRTRSITVRSDGITVSSGRSAIADSLYSGSANRSAAGRPDGPKGSPDEPEGIPDWADRRCILQRLHGNEDTEL
ncbi:hypothetical protein [Parapedobacter tibetensis]|uniref:hypothetical protein n=1 Tax=Parapedobacter tibetensis TaxID=2972951 RepID=UPI00214DD0A8|nr:hypothetical protein [Parapedobacter tibetensis]